uniref:hypothetical protein n=1 Tax=Nonomuraea pusilla TaxID=46177 RepID=UPI0006E378C3|nr:hypothetical protein [Nonomuraea pusilla]
MSRQTGSTSRTEQDVPEPARRIGRWLLAFAVLGGVAAWAVHLVVAWGVVELACSRGHTDVAGVPLKAVVAVATAVPALVAAAALLTCWRLWSRHLRDDGDRRIGRARFLAHLGLWLDGLAVLMIVFGAVAVVVFPPC